MNFAETYDKYKFGDSTNSVEGVNSARRKFADKRYLNEIFNLKFKKIKLCKKLLIKSKYVNFEYFLGKLG